MNNFVKKIFSNRLPINWRIDEDGLLRITICALKEGVYGYDANEVTGLDELKGLEEVQEYIPASQFNEEALKTLEGKSIIIDSHEWRTPETTFTDGLTVGSVAGTPYTKGDGLYCDAIINDAETIKAIQNGTLIEVSAGYDGDLFAESGVFNGIKYDAVQNNFRFNHILLLPKGMGRCGSDVRIVNSKQETKHMATLRLQIGNSKKTYTFTNEEDVKEAEKMVEEERSFNMEQLNEAIEARKITNAEIEELNIKMDELKGQLAEHDITLQEAKAEIESLLTPERMEEMAEEYVEQGNSEEEIVESEYENEDVEIEEKEKEKIMNSIRVLNGKKLPISARIKNTVDFVFSKRGDTPPASWNDASYLVAFETMSSNAKSQNKKTKNSNRILNGAIVRGDVGTSHLSNRERISNSAYGNKGAK